MDLNCLESSSNRWQRFESLSSRQKCRVRRTMKPWVRKLKFCRSGQEPFFEALEYFPNQPHELYTTIAKLIADTTNNHGKDQEERSLWPSQELHYENTSRPKTPDQSSRFSKTLHLERNLPSRTTKQEEGFQILLCIYHLLLHQRYPIFAS